MLPIFFPRTAGARERLWSVYVVSLVTAAISIAACLVLVPGAIRIIKKNVIMPIKDTVALLATFWTAMDREPAREESHLALFPDVRACFNTSPVTSSSFCELS